MDEVAGLASRFVLSLVFLSAGLSKLVRPRSELAHAVRNYELLPARVVGPVSTWLPPLEVALGFALLVGFATVQIAWLAAGLLATFIVGVIVNLARRREIDCGCLGMSMPGPISWWLVLRNTTFGGMAVFLSLSPPGSVALWPVGASSSESALSTSDALAVLLAALLAIAGSVLLVAARRLVKMTAAFDRQSGSRA